MDVNIFPYHPHPGDSHTSEQVTDQVIHLSQGLENLDGFLEFSEYPCSWPLRDH